MGLRSKLAAKAAEATTKAADLAGDLAGAAATEAKERASDAADVTRTGMGKAGEWLQGRDPSASARLKLMTDDSARISVEAFIVLLVDALNDDEVRLISGDDVHRAGKRRQRQAGLVGIFGGPLGLFVASLYSEAMLVCDIVDRHGLALSDEEIAAHLLLLWQLTPDLESARASIEGTGPSVADQLVDERVTKKSLREMSPMDAAQALWRLRKLRDPDELPGTIKLRHFALPNRRTRKITEQVEAQLGVAALPS